MQESPTTYNDKLDADEQISTEEEIASLVFEVRDDLIDEEDCAILSREVLKRVLARFRPDLCD